MNVVLHCRGGGLHGRRDEDGAELGQETAETLAGRAATESLLGRVPEHVAAAGRVVHSLGVREPDADRAQRRLVRATAPSGHCMSVPSIHYKYILLPTGTLPCPLIMLVIY